MRSAFVKALCRLAARDERILLLTADLGFMALEPFRDAYPSRFLNVGVAEQNLIGIAGGLAEAGFIPYAYSIATFAALRPFEFIRNGPVRHQWPVRIVGMGMGFEYGHAGASHYALEDIGALRTMPGLTIVIPADSSQAGNALESTWNHPGPVYYSLGKDDRLSVPGLEGRFALGRIEAIHGGRDLAIFAMGSIAVEAVVAAAELSKLGIKATVAIISSFSPDPMQEAAELLAGVPHAISLEAHTLSGGLASFIALVIASNGLPCRLWPMGVEVQQNGRSGSQPDCWRHYHLDRTSVVKKAVEICRGCCA